MNLSSFDWLIVFAYLVLSLAVGIWAAKKAGENTESFFLAGRNMPWWLLGVSMVATTFQLIHLIWSQTLSVKKV